ncbi:MAG: CAP domain-containing protein [Candidatus Dojkabacteria bacterium]|jgi:hypothetical protein
MKSFFIPNKKNNYKPYLLGKVALTMYTIVLLLVNMFGGLLGIPEAMASTITPNNIINLTNQERSAAGLNTLKTDSRLSAAAQAKANNMFQEQYWDHFGPNGETPWMFISQAGYTYVYAGENLAKGFRTAEGVHEAWMASPTHRENIMSGKYKDIGVAVVEGVLQGKQTILVVQMFGNLTSSVNKTSPPVKAVESVKPSIVDKGEIKSISITSPKSGDILQDANVNIKGEVKNIKGSYFVEILDEGKIIGEVESSSSEWEYDKVSDWEEGEQKISAQVKGLGVKSKEVIFTIDSTPPVLARESVAVKKQEDRFEIMFKVEEDMHTLRFVTGDKIYDFEITEDGYAVLGIAKDEIGDKSLIIIGDEVGNTMEHDISEYFLEGDEQVTHSPSLALWFKNFLGTVDGISLSIVTFVFILLMIEVYVYWKKGLLGKNAGSLFTLGAWWLIILVGIFKGFGGIIN